MSRNTKPESKVSVGAQGCDGGPLVAVVAVDVAVGRGPVTDVRAVVKVGTLNLVANGVTVQPVDARGSVGKTRLSVSILMLKFLNH